MRVQILLVATLALLVSCAGGGGSDSGGTTNPPNPPNPPVTSTYGVFRALKADGAPAQGKAMSLDKASNPSITMAVPRSGHRAVELGDGKILLFGGETSGTSSVFDVFDPETERFTTLPVVSKVLRKWRTSGDFIYAMLRLPSGKVLISGGNWEQADIIEIFDPATQTMEAWYRCWPQTPWRINNVSQMYWMGNNRVLMVGMITAWETGIVPCGNGVLDLTTKKVTPITTPVPVSRGCSVQLGDGSVIIAGGEDTSFTSVNGIYRIDPTTLETTQIGTLKQARQDFAMTVLPDGNIGVYGGAARNVRGDQVVDRLSSVEIISMAAGSVGTTTLSTSFPEGRSSTTAVLLQTGYVLNAGGVNADGHVVSSEFVHNHTTGVAGTTGNLNTPRRYYSVANLSNGRVLISGGFGESGDPAVDSYTTAEIYDPQSKLVIAYDTPVSVTVGTVVHFTSPTSGVVWSVSNGKGSITSDGTFTAVESGQVTVTGTANGVSASVLMTVVPE